MMKRLFMMKRLYSFLLLMAVMCASNVMAQAVSTVDGLSNSKAYTITCQRCFFQNVAGTAALVTSTGSAAGVVTTADATDANQQYAILKGDKGYYLYSVGAAKFINKDGSYSTNPSTSTPILVKETGNADYPLCLYFDSSNYINCQDAGVNEVGYVINSWSTLDAGNQFAVVEAAEPDLTAALTAVDNYENNSITVNVTYSLTVGGVEKASYTTSAIGAAPLEVTYDAPKTFLGATCTSETRAAETFTESKDVTVVYDYTVDTSALPFVPTTIQNGEFAANTKYYYINPAKTTTYAYYKASVNSGNGGLSKSSNVTSSPADTDYFFAFTGDPVGGYYIHNYSAGASKGLWADASDPYYVNVNTTPVIFQLEEGSSTGQYRFRLAGYDETGLAFLNAYYDPLYIYGWSYSSGWSSYARTDGDAQMYITEVSDEILKLALGGQLAITGTTPAEGVVTGGISEINVTFDAPIYRIYSMDHEGAGMEGEDEAKVITMINKDGETVQEFVLEGGDYGYALNEENPNQLDIYFDRPFTTVGTYTISIPTGLVYSEGGLTNAPYNLAYQVTENFEPKTVTARVYNAPFGDFTGTAWPASYLPYDPTLGYYEIKVDVTAKDEVTFKGFNGVTGEDLKVNFETDGSILTIDGEEPDSYGSYWKDNSKLDGVYSGYYIYFSLSSCNIDWETEDGVGHGTAAIGGYEYTSWTQYYNYIEWYMDDRFGSKGDEVVALESITPAEGKVESLSQFVLTYANEFTELRDMAAALTNAAGDTIAAPITATLSEDKKQIILTLAETVTADGIYTLYVPTGVAAREASTGAGYSEGITVTYQIGEDEQPIYSIAAQDYVAEDATGSGATALFDADGKYSNIKVEYYEKSKRLIIYNFMGGEGYNLDIYFNEDGSVKTLNGDTEDSYGSMALYTGCSDYYFAYLYPAYCTFDTASNGSAIIEGYFYKDSNDSGTWGVYGIRWNGGDGVANIEITDQNGAIYNVAGQRVSKATKGLYIMNGRKFMVK